jgi:hypothetical protein
MRKKEFNAISFEAKVVEYYNSLQSHKVYEEKFSRIDKKGGASKAGPLHRVLIELVFFFAHTSFWIDRRRQKRLEEKALFFLQQAGVRQRLLSSFGEGLDNQKSEDYVIKTITQSLGADSLRKEYSIPRDPELFAYFADHLIKIGVDAYFQTGI